ncbi:MAG: adenylate kinase [Clostridia bacterium]|jgi:adenylate kinase|nr:adenylate kinase [Clostridia bacterium]MBT7122370.1 adenylate kinase [Clostridia bacterium]
MKLMFVGPPGAGKGTQATRVAQKYDIPHISSGDMLRAQMRKGSELGIAAKKYIDEGHLVPDDVIVAMIGKRIKEADAQKGFLLDGFPRTAAQAEALDKITKLDMVINVFVPDNKLVHRMTGRRVCDSCSATYHVSMLSDLKTCPKCGGNLYLRDDDAEEIVIERLKVYKESTQPLIQYYTDKGILRDVVGSGGIDTITQTILSVLEGQG